MSEPFVVENPDANNFVVRQLCDGHRFVFHVVPVEGHHHVLSQAPWTRADYRAEPLSHDAQSFAQDEARKLGLIN